VSGGGGLDVTGSLGALSPTFPFITALSSSREPCVFFLGGTAPWLPDLGKGSTDRWDLVQPALASSSLTYTLSK
jgi:hypothetical protein